MPCGIITIPNGALLYPRTSGTYIYPENGSNMYYASGPIIYAPGGNYFYAWSASSNQTWLQILGGTGRAADGYRPDAATGQYDDAHPTYPPPYHERINFHVDANTTVCRRIAYISIVVPSDTTQNNRIAVVQNGVAAYVWTPPAVTVDSTAHTAYAVLSYDNTQGEAAWYLYSPDAWISLEQGRISNRHDNDRYYSGPIIGPSNKRTEVFNVTANLTGANRTGTITVYDALYPPDFFTPNPPTGAALATLTVTQTTSADPTSGGPPWGGPPVPIPTAFSDPFNLHDGRGNYLRSALGADHNIYAWRADKVGPFGGFTQGPVLASPAGVYNNPRMAYDQITRRLFIVFAVQAGSGWNVCENYSDDDCASWNGTTLAIPGGTHPTIAIGIDHTKIIVAYVGAVGGPGKLNATVQGPGDVSPSAVFVLKDQAGADLAAADDTFHLVQPPNGAAIWILTFLYGAETTPSEWMSAEPEGRSWTRIT